MSKYLTFTEILKQLPKKAMPIRIANVIARKDTQARVKTSAAKVAEYRQVYQGEPVGYKKGTVVYEPDATRLPPIILCPAADAIDENPDGGPTERRYYVIDGDHRLTGGGRAGLDTLPALIGPALTLEEARFAVLGANSAHGLSRTNADKDNACAIACETSNGLRANAKKLKGGAWGKISYVGKFANGEKVTARTLGSIAGVSHEKAASYLKEHHAADFTNPKPATKTEKPTGNAKDDETPNAPTVDDGPRDLSAMDPFEFTESIIKQSSVEWLTQVRDILSAYLSNQDEEEAAA